MDCLESEFRKLIVLVDNNSRIKERNFILSLDAQPNNADNPEPVVSYHQATF